MKNRIYEKWQWKEIKRKIAKLKWKKTDPKGYRRLLALHMRGLGMSRKQIAESLEFSEQHITNLVAKYKKHGLDSILQDKRTSNNRHMSFEQESEFLEQFVELAEEGQVITIEAILLKFEEVIGKKSGTSTIYALLKRHGWRKVKPRPRHPGKASDEEITSSKKLTKNTENSYWKKIKEIDEISTSNIKM